MSTTIYGGFEMVKTYRNEELRAYAKQRGVLLWEIADAIGITDASFSRRLRHELPDAERARYMEAVDQIAAAREAVRS